MYKCADLEAKDALLLVFSVSLLTIRPGPEGLFWTICVCLTDLGVRSLDLFKFVTGIWIFPFSVSRICPLYGRMLLDRDLH